MTLGLGVVALAACGDNGNTTDNNTGGAESSGTSGDETPTTTDPTTQTTKTSEDGSSSTTAGSMSATGDETSGTDGTDTQSTEVDPTTGTTEAVSPECGNGEVEGTEECDDGNQEPGDGCEPGCVNSAVCGNEIVETGEACDDGNTEDGDECSADCSQVTVDAECGNGELERGESCDDGNVEDGDGCQADCTPTPAECGNMVVEADEECDDGNDVNGGADDFCKNDCTIHIPAQCQAPAEYVNCDDGINLTDKADKNNALKAIGICNDTPANSVITTDFMFESSNNAAWQVAKGFGTHMIDHDGDPATPMQLFYSPREGSTFLMMSTGLISAPNAQTGVVTEAVNSQSGNGSNNNNGGNQLPPPFRFEQGSNNGAGGTPFQQCDGVKDCSDSLQAQWILGQSDPNDRIFFTFKTKVPAGTYGYSFDFVFCSSEWPSWVNTSYNDMLIAYQVDPAADDPNADPPIDPYTGNITFIPDPNDDTKGLPVTITALDPYFDGPGYTYNEEPLKGTGFEQHACTDWFTAKGGVQPGSDITIGFFLADMRDTILATGVLLDNFRWDCEGCIPSEVDDCGVMPPT